MPRPLLAVDWDGTCVENKWPAMGDWNPGAVNALRKLHKHFDIVIHSVRIAPAEAGSVHVVNGVVYDLPRDEIIVSMEVAGIRRMLDEEGLGDIAIWRKDYKPPALAFVDDRGVHYNGRKGAWDALYTKLMLMAELEPEEHHPLHIPEIDVHSDGVLFGEHL